MAVAFVLCLKAQAVQAFKIKRRSHVSLSDEADRSEEKTKKAAKDEWAIDWEDESRFMCKRDFLSYSVAEAPKSRLKNIFKLCLQRQSQKNQSLCPMKMVSKNLRKIVHLYKNTVWNRRSSQPYWSCLYNFIWVFITK